VVNATVVIATVVGTDSVKVG